MCTATAIGHCGKCCNALCVLITLIFTTTIYSGYYYYLYLLSIWAMTMLMAIAPEKGQMAENIKLKSLAFASKKVS